MDTPFLGTVAAHSRMARFVRKSDPAGFLKLGIPSARKPVQGDLFPAKRNSFRRETCEFCKTVPPSWLLAYCGAVESALA